MTEFISQPGSESEGEFEIDFENMRFTAEIERYNEQINESAMQHVRHVYVERELIDDGEITLPTTLRARTYELTGLYDAAGIYEDDRTTLYMAQRQAYVEYLNEFDLRARLLGSMAQRGSAHDGAVRMFLHAYIDAHFHNDELDEAWHKVISSVFDVDVSGVSEDVDMVVAIHRRAEAAKEQDRSALFQAMLAAHGGEEYLQITGGLQDDSQFSVGLCAWAIAASLRVPLPDETLEPVYREQNRDIMQTHLDSVEMSDEQRKDIWQSISWLL